MADQTIVVIDVGGTSIKCGLVVGRVPQEEQKIFPTDLIRNDTPIESYAALVRKFCAQAGITPNLIVSTVPGFIDTDQDRVLFAGNIQQLNGRPLRSELSRQLGTPVLLERDAILSLSGVLIAGVAQGANDVLGIFFGTGVGAAYLRDGEAFRGGGWALEIGHMPYKGAGRKFEGMRADVLETYVSGRALELIATKHSISVASVFADAAGGNASRGDVAEFLRDQAMAIGTAIALYSPSTVVLGGGVCAMEGFPRSQLEAMVGTYAPFDETGRPMDIRWATLGWRGALYGALKVADSHFRQER